MKAPQKTLAAVMTLLVTLFLLMTGCSTTGTDQTTSTPAGAAATATAAAQPTATPVPNFNETGLPIVNETVTYTAFIRQQGGAGATESDAINQFDIVKMAEQDTNVHMEWVCVPSDVMNERITLLISSGEYPDVFLTATISYDDIKKYAADGIFIRLNDYYDKYMVNEKADMEEIGFNLDPFMKDMDGNIWAIMGGDVSYKVGTALSINKKWLDNLGLPVPETTDDFRDVLTAFRDQDANGNGDSGDEIPFSFTTEYYYIEFLGIFGAYSGYYINDSDEVDFGPLKSEYKDAVKYMNGLYADKLIDQEAFTQDRATYLSKGKIQPSLYGAFLNWRPGEVMTEEVSQAEYMPGLMLSYNGMMNFWPVQNSFNFGPNMAITDKAQNPEILVRWCDYFFDPTISSLVRFGGSPTYTTINDDGSLTANPYPEGITLGDWWVRDGHIQNLPRISIPRAAAYYYSTSPSGREKMAIDAYYQSYCGTEIPRLDSVAMTPEESEQLAQFKTDIGNYVKQTFASWVTGESDVDTGWDSYLQQLDNLGLDDYIALLQTFYNRLKNS